ncbi:MAG: hypothetical protein HY540_01860 [Deltaproteobacteria bacterium]|nr:hypothetical protein [Deltaproteobacteria bacterium]
MRLKKTQTEDDVRFLPIDHEVKQLLDAFEKYLSIRNEGHPVCMLQNAICGMRGILGRIVSDYFLRLPEDREPDFCATLATLLGERAVHCIEKHPDDADYVEYTIGEMLMAFEYAQELKMRFRGDTILQRLLVADIPLLESFDFGLREKLRLVQCA